ncbi:hypothetical protein B0H10DRAFT_1963635 [Mycena sp. CBHHK59/15]|nr:hypothetical protein B0H10DRAFT_1963635 [Mycena sp. CBHHK59/15]
MVNNGWYDPLIQNLAYLTFATNAPGYGLVLDAARNPLGVNPAISLAHPEAGVGRVRSRKHDALELPRVRSARFNEEPLGRLARSLPPVPVPGYPLIGVKFARLQVDIEPKTHVTDEMRSEAVDGSESSSCNKSEEAKEVQVRHGALAEEEAGSLNTKARDSGPKRASLRHGPVGAAKMPLIEMRAGTERETKDERKHSMTSRRVKVRTEECGRGGGGRRDCSEGERKPQVDLSAQRPVQEGARHRFQSASRRPYPLHLAACSTLGDRLRADQHRHQPVPRPPRHAERSGPQRRHEGGQKHAPRTSTQRTRPIQRLQHPKKRAKEFGVKEQRRGSRGRENGSAKEKGGAERMQRGTHLSKQGIHFLRSECCPPTSNMWILGVDASAFGVSRKDWKWDKDGRIGRIGKGRKGGEGKK